MALIVIPTSQAEVNQLVSLLHAYNFEYGYNLGGVEPMIKVDKPIRILSYIGVVHTEFDLKDMYQTCRLVTPNQVAVELKNLYNSEV